VINILSLVLLNIGAIIFTSGLAYSMGCQLFATDRYLSQRWTLSKMLTWRERQEQRGKIVAVIGVATCIIAVAVAAVGFIVGTVDTVSR
jgi:hypothetical protein